jgi:hypothetical protein
MAPAVELERLAHPKAAVEYLGRRLFDGTLALLLGAGVSKPLGLPSWRELLDKGFASLGEPAFDGDDLELGSTRLANACKTHGRDVKELVTSCLYPADGGLTPASLMGSTRLGALGAMLMGSRRGSVSTVLTFNFDSVLEEYLLLHGYVVRVVTDLPALTGSEDVTIFHVYGYLPSKTSSGKASALITFTKESVLKMMGDPNHPFRELLRQTVRSKVLLLLGISGGTATGNALGPILAYEAQHLGSDRPSAFWVGADPVSADLSSVLLDAKVVTVKLPSYDTIDDFLLSICREAATHMTYGKL